MANESPNKFDSGHVVLNVYHPGEDAVHSIAVAADVSLPDLHDSLMGAGYDQHPALNTPVAGPTKEGSLEYSDAFRGAARKAIGMATSDESRRKHGSNAGGEAGFEIRRDGSTGPVNFSADQESTRGSMSQAVSPNTLGIFHTHDSFHQGDPSGADVAAAKKAKTTVYVASRDGLYSVDPSGVRTRVFTNPDWMSRENK